MLISILHFIICSIVRNHFFIPLSCLIHPIIPILKDLNEFEKVPFRRHLPRHRQVGFFTFHSTSFHLLIYSVPQLHPSMLLPMPESIEIQRPSNEEEEIDIEENNHPEPSIHSPMSLATPTVSQTAQSNERNSTINEDQTRQIRFYHDRVDFRGDIIYKPAAAKSKDTLHQLKSIRTLFVFSVQIAEFSGNFFTFFSKILNTNRSFNGKVEVNESFGSFKPIN